MDLNFNTMDDFHFNEKTVILRIDINSPVDPSTDLILDDTRMKLHSKTILELSDKGAKVVVLAHQSRPGKKDFTTLKQHSKVLSAILNRDVSYVDDIFGSRALKKISQLNPGDILLLENVRFYSEESLNFDFNSQTENHMIKNLANIGDYFVNDAFAAAHRSQPSLVGFTSKLPSATGRVMENELKTIEGVLTNIKRPCIYVLGGVKADDSINVMSNALNKGSADLILTTGLIGNIFLLANGYDIGECNEHFILNKNYDDLVDVAKNLSQNFDDKILYPIDVAICDDNKRVDVDINQIPNLPIYDIGSETIQLYAKNIRLAKTLFANGPAGVFENPKFSIGTDDILNSIASSDCFSIIGGGHLAAAASNMRFSNKIDHISSGGGACINLLSGEELFAVKALNNVSTKK